MSKKNSTKVLVIILIAICAAIVVLLVVLMAVASKRINEKKKEEISATLEEIGATKKGESSYIYSSDSTAIETSDAETDGTEYLDDEFSVAYKDYDWNAPELPHIDPSTLEETYDFEPATSRDDADLLDCSNDTTFTALLYNGDKLLVGTEAGLDSCLYIYPRVLSTTGITYAISVQDATDSLYSLAFNAASFGKPTAEGTSYVMWDVSFDLLAPSTPELLYFSFATLDGSYDDIDRDLYIRLYNAENGELLYSYCISIYWTGDSIALTNLRNNDVSFTGELSEEDRQFIIDSMIEELINQDLRNGISTPCEEKAIYSSATRCVVEKVDIPYSLVHDLDTGNRVFIALEYGHLDIYACTMNYVEGESITFYYAPHNQLYGVGFNKAMAPGSDTLDLRLWGYGPFSTSTMYMFLKDNPQLFIKLDARYELDEKYKEYLDQIGDPFYLEYEEMYDY